MTEHTCPPLGTGSVDMNALHAAARQGHDMVKAIEEATTLPSDPNAVPEETAPAPVDATEVAVPAETVAEAEAADAEEAPAPRRARSSE